MRRIVVLFALVALLATAATAVAATRTVKVGDNWFVRDSSGTPTVKVRKGTTVVWKWVGRSPHTVSVTKGPVKFNSRVMKSGTFRKKMRRKGTYRIICSIHPSEQKMVLKVG